MIGGRLLLVLPGIVLTSLNGLFASPVVPGLNGRHPLDEHGAGEILLGELRCVACHADEHSRGLHRPSGPDLASVGQRVSPEYMRKFLANPPSVHPGVKMPDVLSGQSKARRSEVAEALSHFMISLTVESFAGWKPGIGDAMAGRSLFHEIGCVACHASRDGQGREVAGGSQLSLAHVPAKYGHESLAEFLFNPHRTRPSGRMPDFHLSQDESKNLAEYLMGGQPAPARPFKVDAGLVDKGKAYFREYNCVACHSLDGEPPARQSLPLAKLKPGRGCLSSKPRGVPDYNLSDIQRKAIARVLADSRAQISTADAITYSLTAFNCIACHSRDDYGGPSKELLPYLKTSEEGLGDQARIPPGLTLAGAKLKPGWMHKVLFDGEVARPYMLTRMPSFTEANLGFLPGALAEVDRVEPVKFSKPRRKERGKIRQSGTQLVGDKGLNCITCHNFNGRDSPGFKGMDLLISFERLKADWFYHFMRNPAKYRPGIVMPNYWTGKKGVRKDILDGNADAQIWSIWHYFSYGQGAHTPSGINSPRHSLEVGDVVRTYRGRSRIAGYRGIAVGFPNGLNYAFNAETGTLSGLWKGDFISVGWGGQGAGSFNPRSRAVSLAQDLSFHALPNSDAPWPLLPMMNKENPVNPDPLYPKNLGYQFLGYSLDEDFVPTFSYRISDVTIEDKSTSVIKEGQAMLNRMLSISSDEPRTIHFRALVGKVEKVSETSYKTPDLSLSVNANKATPNDLRPLHSDENSFELLLNLSLPKGKSQLRLDYDLLR